MKLGTQDVKLYMGNVEVSKAYLGSTLVHEASSAVDPNLIESNVFVNLPTDRFTESSSHNWSVIQGVGNDVPISMDRKMEGDGAIWFQFKKETLTRTPNLVIATTQNWNEADTSLYAMIYVSGDTFRWRDNGGLNQEAAVEGTYYGMKRIGGVLRVYKTLDKVTITQIATLQSNASFQYLSTSDKTAVLSKFNYFQGTGITSI